MEQARGEIVNGGKEGKNKGANKWRRKSGEEKWANHGKQAKFFVEPRMKGTAPFPGYLRHIQLGRADG